MTIVTLRDKKQSGGHDKLCSACEQLNPIEHVFGLPIDIIDHLDVGIIKEPSRSHRKTSPVQVCKNIWIEKKRIAAILNHRFSAANLHQEGKTHYVVAEPVKRCEP